MVEKIETEVVKPEVIKPEPVKAKKVNPKEVEKFEIVKIYTESKFGNNIDVLLKDGSKIQIAVDKEVELTKDLVGKFVELKHKVIDGKYYFERATKKIV